MRLPNLNTIKTFEACARRLNFRLAAEELHVTQGAVAQQIRKLEADLGVALFARQPRGVTLTHIGERYLARIAPALREIVEATQDLALSPMHLTLSVPPSVAAKWLVQRLPGFADQYPGVEVRLVASEALSNFSADGVDLAIRQGIPPFGDDLHDEELAPLGLCAVASPGYLGEMGPVKGPKDCVRLRLIEDSHRHWARLGVTGAQVLQMNQTALAIDAAIGGQGVAMAPAALVQGGVDAGALRVLWRETGSAGYHLVWPKVRSLSPPAQAMADWLRGEMCPLSV